MTAGPVQIRYVGLQRGFYVFVVVFNGFEVDQGIDIWVGMCDSAEAAWGVAYLCAVRQPA